jgi:hypothetical protein
VKKSRGHEVVLVTRIELHEPRWIDAAHSSSRNESRVSSPLEGMSSPPAGRGYNENPGGEPYGGHGAVRQYTSERESPGGSRLPRLRRSA